MTLFFKKNMKLIKIASGKKIIRISRSEWKSIGKTTGWINAYSDLSSTLLNTLPVTFFKYEDNNKPVYAIDKTNVPLEKTYSALETKVSYRWDKSAKENKASNYSSEVYVMEIIDLATNENIEMDVLMSLSEKDYLKLVNRIQDDIGKQIK